MGVAPYAFTIERGREGRGVVLAAGRVGAGERESAAGGRRGKTNQGVDEGVAGREQVPASDHEDNDIATEPGPEAHRDGGQGRNRREFELRAVGDKQQRLRDRAPPHSHWHRAGGHWAATPAPAQIDSEGRGSPRGRTRPTSRTFPTPPSSSTSPTLLLLSPAHRHLPPPTAHLSHLSISI